MKFNKLKKPYIIAEIGINHDGKFLKAKKLVFEAKKAGADAVKFQVFKPATLEGEKLKKTKFQNKTSEKKSLTNIWRKVSLNYNSLKKLRNYSAKISIDFICTPFDFESLKLIKKLNLKAIKVASSDVTDIPLLLEISKLKKPVIMSTGMSNSKEIDHAIKTINNKNLALLHCVSLYPCEYNKANLNRISSLKKKFKKYVIGYSDHCKNFEASIFAINLGAQIIEKHFTLNKYKIGLDHSLSADPRDLKIICDYAKNIKFLGGKNKITPSKNEIKYSKFSRKGIYVNKKITKDHFIKKENLIIRRPQNMTKPELYSKLIGKKAKKNLNLNESIILKNVY